MERLQKVMARAGVASRRKAEELIVEGRVRVNGRVASELGVRVDPRKDRVEVDGKRIVAEQAVYFVLHKPRGVVSTMSDPEGRPTVADLVREVDARIFPIGRLDFHTSGVLLLTNDGEFSEGLLHPRKDVPKVYVAKVSGLMQEHDLEKWREGVELDDGRTRPADVHKLRHEEGKTWLEVTLVEGRNQQIRRMGEATGYPVMRLSRLSFAGISGERLRPGQWRALSSDELRELKEQYGVPRRVHRPDASQVAGGSLVARGAPSARRGVPAEGEGRSEPGPPLRTRSGERARGRRSAPRSESQPAQAPEGGGPRYGAKGTREGGQKTSAAKRSPTLTRKPSTRTRAGGGRRNG